MVRKTVGWWLIVPATVMFGLACTASTEPTGSLAGYWEIPGSRFPQGGIGDPTAPIRIQLTDTLGGTLVGWGDFGYWRIAGDRVSGRQLQLTLRTYSFVVGRGEDSIVSTWPAVVDDANHFTLGVTQPYVYSFTRIDSLTYFTDICTALSGVPVVLSNGEGGCGSP